MATHRSEIEQLAAKVGATVSEDNEGRISRVLWDGDLYGEGSMDSLVRFAEKAREKK